MIRRTFLVSDSQMQHEKMTRDMWRSMTTIVFR